MEHGKLSSSDVIRSKEILDDLESGSEYLTQWELTFVADVFARWHSGMALTTNQKEKLEELHNELQTRQTP